MVVPVVMYAVFVVAGIDGRSVMIVVDSMSPSSTIIYDACLHYRWVQIGPIFVHLIGAER